MRLISGGRHHATFAFGDLRVVSLRDGYIDMPPERLRDEDGRAFDELPAAVPLAGGTRAALLGQLTRPGHFVAGAHLDSPGIARVISSGDGYALEHLAPPIG